jgi:hypothetical protein
MTCEELRRNFEDHVRDPEVRSDHGGVAEHISTCADCSRFVEEQGELWNNLRLVRESAPPVSESIDATVVLNYRRHLAKEREHSAKPVVHQLHPGSATAWSAIAVALLVGLSFWLFSARRTVTTTQPPTAHQPTVIPTAPVVTQNPAEPVVRTAKHRPAVPLRSSQLRSDRRPAVTAVEARSLPDGFRNLMYCDALSCSGDMNMIRVQLPSSSMPRQVSGSIQAVRSVTADVLVGPDGIARGIRLEEIEF